MRTMDISMIISILGAILTGVSTTTIFKAAIVGGSVVRSHVDVVGLSVWKD